MSLRPPELRRQNTPDLKKPKPFQRPEDRSPPKEAVVEDEATRLEREKRERAMQLVSTMKFLDKLAESQPDSRTEEMQDAYILETQVRGLAQMGHINFGVSTQVLSALSAYKSHLRATQPEYATDDVDMTKEKRNRDEMRTSLSLSGMPSNLEKYSAASGVTGGAMSFIAGEIAGQFSGLSDEDLENLTKEEYSERTEKQYNDQLWQIVKDTLREQWPQVAISVGVTIATSWFPVMGFFAPGLQTLIAHSTGMNWLGPKSYREMLAPTRLGDGRNPFLSGDKLRRYTNKELLDTMRQWRGEGLSNWNGFKGGQQQLTKMIGMFENIPSGLFAHSLFAIIVRAASLHVGKRVHYNQVYRPEYRKKYFEHWKKQHPVDKKAVAAATRLLVTDEYKADIMRRESLASTAVQTALGKTPSKKNAEGLSAALVAYRTIHEEVQQTAYSDEDWGQEDVDWYWEEYEDETSETGEEQQQDYAAGDDVYLPPLLDEDGNNVFADIGLGASLKKQGMVNAIVDAFLARRMAAQQLK